MEKLEFNYNRLKAERVARGLKVKDLADELEISVFAYYKKESGKTAITVKDLSIISSKLGIKDLNIFFDLKVS